MPQRPGIRSQYCNVIENSVVDANRSRDGDIILNRLRDSWQIYVISHTESGARQAHTSSKLECASNWVNELDGTYTSTPYNEVACGKCLSFGVK